MVDLRWKQRELLLVLNLDARDGENDEARRQEEVSIVAA